MVRMYSGGLGLSSKLLQWYDRNPVPNMIAYRANGVAPHTVTIRASYTVPAGKKAMVVFSSAMIMRATAATTVGRVHGNAGTPTAGTFDCYHKNNTVDSMVTVQNAEMIVVGAGITLSITTEDLSTGGTMDYDLSVIYIEFDA